MTHTLDDILLPLAITVIIDNKVRDPERKAFVERANGLLELFEMETLSREDLMGWFASKKDILEEKLNGKRRNTTVLSALSKFEDDVEVENVYDAMVAISVSDQKFVREESDLIKSAGAIWGFPKPPIKVVQDDD